MKVIILSKSSYKEKDCIYNAISQDGYISFLAKGAQDPKSKFVWLNNPLTIADVDFLSDGRYKHKVINNATLISSPMTKSNDYEYLVYVNIVADLTRNVLMDEEKHQLFNEVEQVMNAMREGKDRLMAVLIYLARLTRLSGSELEVDKCVFCGDRKEIVAFSFVDGGFICKHCQNEDTVKDLSKDQMLLLRYAFKAKSYSMEKTDRFTDEDKRYVLKKLRDFVDEFVGVKLNSLDAIIK